MQKVIASSNSIAAGRDVNIHLDLSDHPPAIEEILRRIVMAAGGDPTIVENLLADPSDDRSKDEIVSTVRMIAKSSASLPDDPYSAYFAGIEDLKHLLRKAQQEFRCKAYVAAHHLFGRALNLVTSEEVKPRLIYDFLVSGYVGFSLNSDTDAMRGVIATVRAEHAAYIDRETEIAIAEVHQEVATRQLHDDMLVENESILDDLTARYGDAEPAILNLQGLLYRRLGERKSSGDRRQALLERARRIVETIARQSGPRMTAEYLNNWGITLVRLFELTGDVTALDEAERVLSSIDFTAVEVSISELLALPKALNNLGNVAKQRLLITGETSLQADAIEHYTRAERYWEEAHSPYEWAMLQKNKAEVRSVAMKLGGYRREAAKRAMDEIDNSLKYRSLERAPYQYERSMVVKRELEKLIAANGGG